MRLLTLALLATSAWSHEIGTSRVSAVFHNNSYEIEIVTDATALAEKLEAAVGGTELPSNTDARKLQSLLAGREDVFRQRIRVSFDDVAVRPVIDYTVAPPIDANSAWRDSGWGARVWMAVRVDVFLLCADVAQWRGGESGDAMD